MLFRSYVDGGFDLFTPGHIEFLKLVYETETQLSRSEGWDKDYAPIFVIAGVHDDSTVHRHKGLNYPIMNIYERGLCVLGCRYVDAVIFKTPWNLSRSFLSNTPYDRPVDAVYHGPTKAFGAGQVDPYIVAKGMG